MDSAWQFERSKPRRKKQWEHVAQGRNKVRSMSGHAVPHARPSRERGGRHHKQPGCLLRQPRMQAVLSYSVTSPGAGRATHQMDAIHLTECLWDNFGEDASACHTGVPPNTLVSPAALMESVQLPTQWTEARTPARMHLERLALCPCPCEPRLCMKFGDANAARQTGKKRFFHPS